VSPDVKIVLEDGVVRATYRGEVAYDPVFEMIRSVARTAVQRQSDLLLFDIREAVFREFHVAIIKFAEEARGLGIEPTFRIAVLAAMEVERLKYLEDVAVNRGFQVKVFTEESEALAWLKSAP
jgi:hypothetical protein